MHLVYLYCGPRLARPSTQRGARALSSSRYRENRALNWCKDGQCDHSHRTCIAADFQYLVRVFSDFGVRWSRRSTLAFVAFALIVVAFTALALSWNGLSAFRSSATAEPGPNYVAAR
jgi:hypothetical protein